MPYMDPMGTDTHQYTIPSMYLTVSQDPKTYLANDVLKPLLNIMVPTIVGTSSNPPSKLYSCKWLKQLGCCIHLSIERVPNQRSSRKRCSKAQKRRQKEKRRKQRKRERRKDEETKETKKTSKIKASKVPFPRKNTSVLGDWWVRWWFGSRGWFFWCFFLGEGKHQFFWIHESILLYLPVHSWRRRHRFVQPQSPLKSFQFSYIKSQFSNFL